MKNRFCFVVLLSVLICEAYRASADETDLLDLASGAIVLSYTSEYNAAWSALLLLDGTSQRGWCNDKPNPNEFVIELAGPYLINKLVLDTSGNQEPSYPGISARLIEVSASTVSSTTGYSKIGEFEAAKNMRKEFPLIKPAKAQWLKFVVRSNWGHAQWSELMELEAYGTPAGEPSKPNISGTYETNYGPIVLKQSGNEIRGCYYEGSGTFSGTVNGRSLQMEWRQDQGKRSGGMLMVLSADGKFLNGLWYQGGQLGGKWFGNRITPEKDPCPIKGTNVIADALMSSGRTLLYGIQFDSDSAKLKSKSDPTLQQIQEALKSNAKMNLIIEGHTDSINTDEYNLQLSEKRAAAVVDWLINHGIDKARLTSKGFGKQKPVADNSTPQGRALNRRVEIALQN